METSQNIALFTLTVMKFTKKPQDQHNFVWIYITLITELVSAVMFHYCVCLHKKYNHHHLPFGGER